MTGMRSPASDGPTKRVEWNRAEFLAGHDARQHRMAGGLLERIDAARPEREQDQDLDGQHPRQLQDRQRHRLQEQHELGDAHLHERIMPVRDGPGESRQKDHGRQIGRRHRPQPGGGMGQLPGQPAHPHPLHPAGEIAGHATAHEQGVIAV
jgi:hypothetical protein